MFERDDIRVDNVLLAESDLTLTVLGQRFTVDFNPPIVTGLKLQEQVLPAIHQFSCSLSCARVTFVIYADHGRLPAVPPEADVPLRRREGHLQV